MNHNPSEHIPEHPSPYSGEHVKPHAKFVCSKCGHRSSVHGNCPKDNQKLEEVCSHCGYAKKECICN